MYVLIEFAAVIDGENFNPGEVVRVKKDVGESLIVAGIGVEQEGDDDES